MVDLLLLIIVANSSPVVIRNLLGSHGSRPIDGGLGLGDNRPLFGQSKTWRGLIVAVAACGVAAPLLGHPISIGLATGTIAMIGDLLASFMKRRLGYETSSQSVILDTVPEALLPAVLLKDTFGLSWFDAVLLVCLFTAIVKLTSPLLYRLGIRNRPW